MSAATSGMQALMPGLAEKNWLPTVRYICKRQEEEGQAANLCKVAAASPGRVGPLAQCSSRELS